MCTQQTLAHNSIPPLETSSNIDSFSYLLKTPKVQLLIYKSPLLTPRVHPRGKLNSLASARVKYWSKPLSLQGLMGTVKKMLGEACSIGRFFKP